MSIIKQEIELYIECEPLKLGCEVDLFLRIVGGVHPAVATSSGGAEWRMWCGTCSPFWLIPEQRRECEHSVNTVWTQCERSVNAVHVITACWTYTT